MKYAPYYTNRIKRQLKTLEKRGYDMNNFKEVVGMLLDGISLPLKYRDHPLHGDKRGYRDCYIQDNWVLIYLVSA
jgi:mRNA interferase YafQ